MHKSNIDEYKNYIKLFSTRIIKEKQMKIKNRVQLITYVSSISQKIFNNLNSITLSDETIEEIINLILEHISLKMLLNDINKCYKKRFFNKIRTKKQMISFFKEKYTTVSLLTEPLRELSALTESSSNYFLYQSTNRLIKRHILSCDSIKQYVFDCLNDYYKL